MDTFKLHCMAVLYIIMYLINMKLYAYYATHKKSTFLRLLGCVHFSVTLTTVII